MQCGISWLGHITSLGGATWHSHCLLFLYVYTKLHMSITLSYKLRLRWCFHHWNHLNEICDSVPVFLRFKDFNFSAFLDPLGSLC